MLSRPPTRNAPPSQRPGRLDRTVTHRLHTLVKLTDRISQQAYAQQAGLAPGEGRCLAAVGAYGPLSVNDLALHANLTKGQASRAAQSLVDQGLVDKAASPADGRGVVLTLTASGQDRWHQVMALIHRRNTEVVGGLSADERRLLDILLDKLLAQARASLQRGPATPTDAG